MPETPPGFGEICLSAAHRAAAAEGDGSRPKRAGFRDVMTPCFNAQRHPLKDFWR